MDTENSTAQNSYSRRNAVNYALRYALHPNRGYRYFQLFQYIGGDCANFISQCLRAGGAPMSYDRRSPWWYNNKATQDTRDDTWSVSWAVAHSLYWTLKINYQNGFPGPKGREVYDVNQLELGDLCFYEDNRGLIFHSAIVTAFGSVPLVSYHTRESLNIPYTKPYAAKKIHFIKVSI